MLNNTRSYQILLDLIWGDWQKRKTPEGIYGYGYQGIGNAQLAQALGILHRGEAYYTPRIQRIMTQLVPLFADRYPGHSLHRDGGGLARVVINADDPKPYKSDLRRLRTMHTLAKRKVAGLNHVPGNSTDPTQIGVYVQATILVQQLEALTNAVESLETAAPVPIAA